MKLKLAAAAAAVLVAPIVGLAPPSGAQAGDVTLTVEKKVEGPVPVDATFTIDVQCSFLSPPPDLAAPDDLPPPFGDTFTFGAAGGEEFLDIPYSSECSITETNDGGAAEVIGGSQTVTFESPVSKTATVTNVFVAPATTVAPPTTAKVAPTVVAAPRFTG